LDLHIVKHTHHVYQLIHTPVLLFFGSGCSSVKLPVENITFYLDQLLSKTEAGNKRALLLHLLDFKIHTSYRQCIGTISI